MDGMDMDGMSMDSASSGLFLPMNQTIARGYWYAIASVVAGLTVIRITSSLQAWQRRRRHQTSPHCIPSRPRGYISQLYATTTAICREAFYPQPWHFSGSISKYFTPLPIGRWLLLTAYWVALLVSLWSNAILQSDDDMYAYKWEKVGFRAAWVSVTQIPFIYLLSTKFNPISLLTGISHERINWLHRWAARTLFLTAIVHWSFFFEEWVLADFVQDQLQMMPMVNYGFGAWGVMGWMVLSGFGFFRAKAYELFVIQHIAAAGALLWLLYMHVPVYAQYNIWLSVAFVSVDWSFRIIWNIARNLHVLGAWKLRALGYSCTLEELPGGMVRMKVENVDFRWRAGQHAFVSVPALRPLELHPFTIANAVDDHAHSGGRDLTFVIKPHKGFSKSLHKAALKSHISGRKYRAFLSGPWGYPPDLSHYETVVFIATSTGASFTTPLISDLIRAPGCVRKIVAHWIVSRPEHFQWFGDVLTRLVQQAKHSRLSLQVVIHVTQAATTRVDSQAGLVGFEATPEPKKKDTSAVDSRSMKDSISIASSPSDEKAPLSPSLLAPATLTTRYEGRPTIDSMVRGPVEEALGETAVVACGGASLTAQARTFIASLSDERAVHKGTGAQGIFLFTETYGW